MDEIMNLLVEIWLKYFRRSLWRATTTSPGNGGMHVD